MRLSNSTIPFSVLAVALSLRFCIAQNVSTLPDTHQHMNKQIVHTSGAPSPIGPYSQGVAAGNMLFISGQVAKDPATGNLMMTDIQSETRQVMENIKAILAAGGFSFSQVVKTTIFLTDMKNFSAMNDVYGSYFTGEFPARETVQVSALPLGVNVEISMIAMK
jgi:2-iminobutanoate/2-iminopropanoate deaminase